LVTFVFGLKMLPPLKFKYKGLALFIVSITALYFLRNFPPAVIHQVEYQLICRPEAAAMLKHVKQRQRNGQVMLVREPYFPFDSSNNLSKQMWGASLQDLDHHKAELFGTKRSFGEQFVLEGPQYNMNEKALNWSDKQIFYKMVLNEETFTTPAGSTFKKVLEDKCGLMLWEKMK